MGAYKYSHAYPNRQQEINKVRSEMGAHNTQAYTKGHISQHGTTLSIHPFLIRMKAIQSKETGLFFFLTSS